MVISDSSLILFAGLQGLPPLVGPLIPDSTGVVTGIVRRADTGQPIPEAQVVLASPAESVDQAMTRATLTDPNGKFTIKGVMPGQYVVITQSEGHFSLSGESASNQARKDVRVSEGQQTDAGVLELIRGATISGRVTGPEGQPLTGAIVQALRPSYIRGRLAFTAFKSTRTDDLGEYRLFWLPPGEYYIRGQYRMGSQQTPERYLKVFFPGIAEEDAAPPILVNGGAEVAGIDVRVPVTPISGFRIAGRVISAGDPADLRVTAVYVIPRDRRVALVDDDSDRFQNQATDVSGGNFEVHNVIPGAYNLFVLTNDGNVLPSVPLDVVDRNIENVAATVEPGVDLHGRVTLDGGKPGDRFSKNSIQLATLDQLPGVGRQRFPINPDIETGEFVLRNMLPGRYVLQLAAFRAPDIYVADARIGQDSVFDSGFTIGGESQESLEVVMKSQGGIVSGKVLDSTRLRPAFYTTVVLVPESSRRQNLALYRQTISENGTFTFNAVPPGAYKLFAWGSVIPGAWENNLFLQRFETRGVAISVDAGLEKNAQLTVIP